MDADENDPQERNGKGDFIKKILLDTLKKIAF